MKVSLRIVAITAFAMAVAQAAAAQNASGLLSTVEVQRLVVADTPDAHAALAKHFVALGAIYKVDAARYAARAELPVGNPNHPFSTDTRERRTRQADAASAAALTVRAVAAYHQILSVGGMTRRPAGAAAFDGGRGAPPPTPAELERLVRSADTPSAHRELVEYFVNVARTETATAESYALSARMTRVSGARNTAGLAARYEQLARGAREAARQANLAVELHHQLARIG